MSIIQAFQQHLMSGLTSSVMVMKLWVLVPLIVQVYLVKFHGDCYQSMVGVLLQGVMVGGCHVNNIQVFFI